MIDRRELLTLGGFLGLAPADAPDGVAAGNGQSLDARALGALADELHNLRTAVLQQYSFEAILPVRKSQQDYLKANGKFPDFIDLGIDVWTAIHDWHIRLQQPLVLGRDLNGRYTMMLGFTALVLRQDAVPTLIGIPYDQR